VNILDLCDRNTAVVSLDATVEQAIRVMLACQVGAVAVIDEFQHVAGIFTERDVLVKVALSGRSPADTPVRELMTWPVQTGSPDVTPGQALTMMLECHFRHLPIVEVDGRVLGILSIRNLLQWRADDLHHELESLEQYYSNDSLGG
jgi:CBS domain-containing protein